MSPVALICSACGQLVAQQEAVRGRHPECQRAGERARQRVRDPGYTRLMNSAAWRRVRDRVRARDGDCVFRQDGYCSGRREVHHLTKATLDAESALDETNLVLVCRAHHSRLEQR
jgi:5-methylcytosine-specific restriction endonuclease McrA